MIKKISLLNACESIFSGGTPERSKLDYWDGDIPWLSSGETEQDYILETEEKITALGLKNKTMPMANKSDIIMASAGQGKTRGQVSYSLIDTYVNQSTLVLRADQSIIDPLYLFYNLKYCYDELRHYSDSRSSRGSLTKDLIEKFEIRIVECDEQKRIAKILFGLDSKILLNQKSNKILFNMLQTVFEHWFIDFEFPDESEKPYKSNGGKIVSPKDVYSFSTFCKKIPENWTVEKLPALASVIDCLHSKKPNLIDDGSIFFQHNSIGKNGLIDLEEIFHISDDDYKQWMSRIEASEGDIMIINAPAGSVAQIPYFLKGVIGRNITAVRSNLKMSTPTFLLEYFLSKYMRAEFYKKSTTGTILSSINVQNIESLSILTPPMPIIEKFEKIARPLRKKIENNLYEIHILTNMKNVLLPKFITKGVDND